MHIHGNSMSIQHASFYAAAQEEKTAAARRAADVRKRLLKSATGTEASASPEEAFLIGKWLDARSSRNLDEDQYHGSASGRDPDFG